MGPKPMATRAWIALLCTGVLAAACARDALPVRSEAGQRIVLLAVDAADWLTIDPMIRAGQLPAFSRLKALGATGVMTPTPPLISPMIWTTVATGVEPENHGILDFMADLPDGRQVPVGTSQRLAPAVWNLFSDAGRRVAVVGWWGTWPAESVNGTIVSDALAPQLARPSPRARPAIVSPAATEAALRTYQVDAASLTQRDLADYIALNDTEFQQARSTADDAASTFYANPIAHLSAVIAGARTYGAIAEHLATSDRPDLLLVYFEAIDTISHLFVRDKVRGPSAIARAYVDADALLMTLARASPPDALLVVVSDHGFHSAASGIAEDPANLAGPATAWHRPYGIVGVAAAGAIATGAVSETVTQTDIGTVRPVDVAPTLLHAAGIGVPGDMPGRVITSMLPNARKGAPVDRTATVKFNPPALPKDDAQDGEAVERLRALGYVSGTRTSLARQNLGESLFRRGRLTEAERELRAVTSAQPDNVAAWLWLAQTVLKQGRGRDALTIFEKAVALPGGGQDALVQAVDLALAEHADDVAQRMVRSAKAPPAMSEVARAAIAEAKGDRTTAERDYRAALATDPLSFEAAARLLNLAIASGRPASAGGAVERAVKLAPDSARHLALLGQLRLAVKDGAGAEAALRSALLRAPDAAPVRIELARALLVQKKPADAISVLEAAPSTRDRDVLLGSAYAQQHDWSKAAVHLRAALDAPPGSRDVTVLNGLGWAQLQLGERDEAARLFTESLAINSQQTEIRRLLEDIRRARGGQGH